MTLDSIHVLTIHSQALSIVERPAFIRLLKYLRPSIKDSDIPVRNTIRKYILQLAEEVEDTLRTKFKVCTLPLIVFPNDTCTENPQQALPDPRRLDIRRG